MPGKKNETATLVGHDDVPQGFAIGDVVTIDIPATGNRRLIVAEVRQYSGEPNCPIADYVLPGDPGASPQIRLRVLPSQGGKSDSTHRTLVLTLYDRLPFNEGLLAVVQDDTKKFVIGVESEHIHDEFWRVNDVDGSHVSPVIGRSSPTKTASAMQTALANRVKMMLA